MSVADEVRRLYAEGKDEAEILSALAGRATYGGIHATMSRIRRRELGRPARVQGCTPALRPIPCELPPASHARFAAEAARRGVTIAELLRQLATVVATDDLFSALLEV